RDPSRAGLPGPARPQREADAVRAARGRGERGDPAHRDLRDAARGLRLGAVLLAPGFALLQRGADPARPARRLPASQGIAARGGRAVAAAAARRRAGRRGVDVVIGTSSGADSLRRMREAVAVLALALLPTTSRGDEPGTLLRHPDTSRFWLSGQANLIFQW